MSVAVRIISQ